MERASLDQLSRKATLSRNLPDDTALHRQRLARWAALLDRNPFRLIETFSQTEHLDPAMRDEMRCENSALTVAFEDPALREAGLTDDRYGTAKQFFGLTDRQMHWIICNCHHGARLRAGTLATIIRATMVKPPRTSVFAVIRRMLMGVTAG